MKVLITGLALVQDTARLLACIWLTSNVGSTSALLPDHRQVCTGATVAGKSRVKHQGWFIWSKWVSRETHSAPCFGQSCSTGPCGMLSPVGEHPLPFGPLRKATCIFWLSPIRSCWYAAHRARKINKSYRTVASSILHVGPGHWNL